MKGNVNKVMLRVIFDKSWLKSYGGLLARDTLDIIFRHVYIYILHAFCIGTTDCAYIFLLNILFWCQFVVNLLYFFAYYY